MRCVWLDSSTTTSCRRCNSAHTRVSMQMGSHAFRTPQSAHLRALFPYALLTDVLALTFVGNDQAWSLLPAGAGQEPARSFAAPLRQPCGAQLIALFASYHARVALVH